MGKPAVLWELRYWNAARYGKTCGFIGTMLLERYALWENLRFYGNYVVGALRESAFQLKGVTVVPSFGLRLGKSKA